MSDLELARQLAQMWIKPTTVSSVAEMPATMTAVTVTSRSYEEITNELANLIAPLLARMRLDEARWWANGEHTSKGALAMNTNRPCHRCERIRILEQAAGGSAAGGGE